PVAFPPTPHNIPRGGRPAPVPPPDLACLEVSPLALLLFAVTLFVSAFLLFLVQPMIGKMILPRLGGTPQVWNTCMVFFQSALLAGYAYSHTVGTKLSLRRQLLVHSLLLLVPLLILLPWGPFNVTGWVPPPGANPLFSTLGILTVVVGVPFIVVATSAPLLQKWFAYTGHPAARDPYFLSMASNLGSMLALLAYPWIVEPNFRLQPEGFAEVGGLASFDLDSQNWIWAVGYILMIVLVAACALLVRMAAPSVQLAGAPRDLAPPPQGLPAPPPEPVPHAHAPARPHRPPRPRRRPPAAAPPRPAPRPAPRPRGGARPPPPPPRTPPAPPPPPAPPAPPRPYEMTAWRRLRWVGLAAVPSSLML